MWRLSSAFASNSARFRNECEADQLFSGSWRTTRAVTVRKHYTVSHPQFSNALAQMPGLRTLCINGCRLTEVPTAIAMLTSLERLELRDNLLTALPAELGRLTRLRILQLVGNRITVLPDALAALSSLERCAR
jgi:Leucine-rich repeat (LRR) protein